MIGLVYFGPMALLLLLAAAFAWERDFDSTVFGTIVLAIVPGVNFAIVVYFLISGTGMLLREIRNKNR